MGRASRRRNSARAGARSTRTDATAGTIAPGAARAHQQIAGPDGPASIFAGHALWVSLALVVASIVVYLPVRHFPFVNTDDAVYVTANPNVMQGLSWSNVEWAFTEGRVPYWQPLTFISHMLDVQLYGTSAGGHHVTSVLLHGASALLLFGLLFEMTGGLWRSAVVAGLFALHPLRVESVAWVAERKDVLSTAFWIATTWAYVRYVRHADRTRYAALILLFGLGLMAKPMIVTLPFSLVLLDYWPLQRIPLDAGWRAAGARLGPLLKEKIPLFALALLASGLTFSAQRDAGAVESLAALPLRLRVANAIVSYVAYIADLFWPVRLAALYPYPKSVASGTAITAGAILVALTVLVVALRRRRPYLLVGWLWYLGTLLPVIGLVQVGPQARADRFTYVPHIGLLIMVVWGIADLANRWSRGRVVLIPVTAAALAACGVLTARQVETWKSSRALWEHTLAITRDNGVAHYNYGVMLDAEGHDSDAVLHLREAVRLEPDFATAHNRLAIALNRRGDQTGASAELKEVVRLMPQSAAAYANLGVSLAKEGRTAEAIEAFSQAVLLNPKDATTRGRLEFLRRGAATKPTSP